MKNFKLWKVYLPAWLLNLFYSQKKKKSKKQKNTYFVKYNHAQMFKIPFTTLQEYK